MWLVLTSGTVLQGRYRIVRLLSEGGMSRVYLAADQLLGPQVAVKEMKEQGEGGSEQARLQLEQEARTLAALEHPGLPRATDLFCSSGRHFLVMDFVEGATLEAIVHQRQAPLDQPHALAVARQICGVLSYLHGLQPPVIFRDLKPSNVIEGPDGRIKLVDFGISKAIEPGEGTQTSIRGAGTPGFAPPEQYGQHGKGHTDGRSDLYALGALLYALLTGTIPTEATDRWMNGVALPEPRALNPRITAGCQRLILHLLELRPADRPASAEEVLASVRSLEAEAEREAASPWAGGASGLPTLSRLAGAGKARRSRAALVLALVGLSALGAWSLLSPSGRGAHSAPRQQAGSVKETSEQAGRSSASTQAPAPGPGQRVQRPLLESGEQAQAASRSARGPFPSGAGAPGAAASAQRAAPRAQVVTCLVSVQPEGADLWLDGRWMGRCQRAPLSLELEAGHHVIKASRAGWITARRTIATAPQSQSAGKPLLPVELRLSPAARLRLEVQPRHARVTLGGRALDGGSQTLGGLAAGSYRYKIDAAGYESREGRVLLAPGKQALLRVALEPVPAERPRTQPRQPVVPPPAAGRARAPQAPRPLPASPPAATPIGAESDEGPPAPLATPR